jgi:hypothetical protein
VLPRKVADSGTAERTMMWGAITGSHYIEPHTAIGLGLAAAAYTKPVSKGASWAMNRLAQPGGPSRNALAGLAQQGGQALAAPMGGMAAGNIPTMTIRPGDRRQ